MATDKLVAMNIFRRVAELGSFTRAADDLEITAATVSKHISEAIDSFLNRFPEIDIDLQLSDRMVDLVEQGVDIAIRIRSSLADSSLMARPLRTSRNIVCASPRYLESAPEIRGPEDLTQHNCLTFSLHDRPRVWELGDREVRVSGNYRTDSSLAIRQSLLRGAGVGFLPRRY